MVMKLAVILSEAEDLQLIVWSKLNADASRSCTLGEANGLSMTARFFAPPFVCRDKRREETSSRGTLKAYHPTCLKGHYRCHATFLLVCSQLAFCLRRFEGAWEKMRRLPNPLCLKHPLAVCR
jgi:hypothetical protein